MLGDGGGGGVGKGCHKTGEVAHPPVLKQQIYSQYLYIEGKESE